MTAGPRGRARYPATYAAERPDDDALILASTGSRQSWGELDRASDEIARALRDLGVERGDHIALVVGNVPVFFDVMWAALRSGLLYTAVNTYLTPREVTGVLRACAPSVVIATRPFVDLVDQAWPHLATRPHLIAVADVGEPRSWPTGWRDLDDVRGACSPAPLAEAEGAPLWFSSGTSGQPKAVVRPLPDCPPGFGDPVAAHYAEIFGLDETTVHLCVGPLHHAAPVGFSTAVHRAGGTVVLTERFDPEELLTWIDRYGVTSTHLVPTMFVRLLKLPDAVRSSFDLGSLRTVLHGAAPCPAEVKRQMIEWWGPVLEEYYGGTEGIGSTVVSSREWLERPGTVGRASRGTIHITDESGSELDVGETGLVWFDNPDFTARYRDDADETDAITHPAGWQTLGDIDHLDEADYLFLTDRWSHKIVTGGVNVFPREIEDVLLQHPAVLDVAVIGVPHAEMGEEVKAVVQLVDPSAASDDTAQVLLTWCRERLARFKCPRSVDFDPSLPRSDNGKLYKRRIRDRYWADQGRQI